MTIIIAYQIPNGAYVASELSQNEDIDASIATCIHDNYSTGDVAYSLAKMGRIQALKPRLRDLTGGPAVPGNMMYEPHYITDKKKLITDTYSYAYYNDNWQVHIPIGGFDWLPLRKETITKIKEIEIKKHIERRQSNPYQDYKEIYEKLYKRPKYIKNKPYKWVDDWSNTWVSTTPDYAELEKRIIGSIKGKK